jgi:DNA polymerase-3 subunit gamma/tau
MLSSQAWNAFLKTLEEPPPNTIFVLATTEAQKVLPTVVDRCHRFDFARPTVEQIATVVTRVATAEEIEIGPDAVALLARHATGSFRDALGTLEQLVTYTGTTVATDDVLAVLGVADSDLLFDALDAVAAGDARSAWLAAARLADTGRDIAQFLKDLEAHARDLLVVQTLGEVPAELRLTPDRDERLAEQAQRVPGASIIRLLDLLAEALRTIKEGADARTRLETALVKAASPELDPTTRALTTRLERLESALASGGGVARAAGPAGAGRGARGPPATRGCGACRGGGRGAGRGGGTGTEGGTPRGRGAARGGGAGRGGGADRARTASSLAALSGAGARASGGAERPPAGRGAGAERRADRAPRRRGRGRGPHPRSHPLALARRPGLPARRQGRARRVALRGPARRAARQAARRRLRAGRRLQPPHGRPPR